MGTSNYNALITNLRNVAVYRLCIHSGWDLLSLVDVKFIRVIWMQELNQPIPASRCSVGPEVLLGTSKNAVDLVELARSALAVNLLQELQRFSFDEETALVTLSQVAGCDLMLPNRFIKVPALFPVHHL